MLNIRRKSGTAPLRYTVLAVGSLIMGMIGITNGVEITNACVRYANSNYNCYEVEPGESYTLKGYDLTISNNLNFTSDETEGILITKYTSSSSKNYTTTVFWNGTGLYHSEGHEGNGGTAIWLLSGAYVSDSTEYTGVVNSLANQTLNIQPMSDILQTVNGHGVSRIVYMLRADFQAYPYYCFIYDDIDYSFCISNDTNNQSLSDSVWNKYLEKKTGANFYNTPSELVNYLYTTYGISESPIIEGSLSNNTTNTPCITIEQLINMGGSDYNTGMCYTDSKYWSGNATTGEFIQTTPQSIFTLYPTYTELREEMNIYNNYCNNYVATQQACINAFSGSKQLNITLLDKLKGKNNTRLNTLYDYCKTREVYSGSLETNTCDLTDEDIKNIVPSMLTPEGQAENLMQQGITTTKPGEETVYDGLVDDNQRDIITAIPRVIEKIESMFFNNSGVQGIIPDYITRIILLTVLFLIFKH